ncbi:unnamed protein product [Spirodela intermedia]|uniref:Uncharacterized protein n=1 Tax=Spirodela intermedia TaxID=51605 RepID=A0A7I8J4G8_SPIIN|nr:unnamed protein product [Spirodela intermedia]CAA6664960.1 unnamed protein product [Spirodela intermedia]
MAISSLSSSAACRFAPHCGRIASGSASSSFGHSPCFLFLPFSASPARILALRAVKGAQVGKVGGSHGASQDPGPLRRPLVSPLPEDEEEEEDGSAGGVPRCDDADEIDDGGRPTEEPRGGSRRRKPDWVDWEDQILQDTVPYGDRLSPEHEKMILERLLPYHPEFEIKIGCGVDFITIGYHPDFESSRCLFIVRKDGELIDFSYWKCIKGLIRNKYPLYADSFILRHFRKRRQ